MPRAVVGRVYQGLKEPAPDNYGYTIDELKEMCATKSLKGKPILLEHEGEPIGEIGKTWVDDAGFLVIYANLYDAETLGNQELYEDVQKRVANRELSDFSIHWKGSRDKTTKVVRPTSKSFLEASLTTEGFYNNTKLLSVAASADSNSEVVAQGCGKIIMDQSDIQSMLQENGLGHLNAAEFNGMSAAQFAAILAQEAAKAKDEAAKQVEERLAPQSAMTDAERQELESFRKMKEEQEKRYAEEAERYREREVKNVDSIFDGIKHMVPEEQHAAFKDNLGELAGQMSAKTYWDAFKLYNQVALDRQAKIDEYVKREAKFTKDNNALMKEARELKMQLGAAELAQQNTAVEQAASKRKAGVGFTPTSAPKRQIVEKAPAKTDAESGDEVVEEQASALTKLEQAWFPKAFAVPNGYDTTDEAARNFLSFVQEKQQSMSLGIGQPLIKQNDFRGPMKGYSTMPY
jgi:hypothetical protein